MSNGYRTWIRYRILRLCWTMSARLVRMVNKFFSQRLLNFIHKHDPYYTKESNNVTT